MRKRERKGEKKTEKTGRTQKLCPKHPENEGGNKRKGAGEDP